jgi:dihydroorotase
MEIHLKNPFNGHVHFRGGPKPCASDLIFQTVVPFTEQQFGTAIIIGNTRPEAIENAAQAVAYRKRIKKIAPRLHAVMAIMITKDTTPEMIFAAKKILGDVVGKLMPLNVTTNSERGVGDLTSLYPTFGAMVLAGMPLLDHMESSDPNVHPRDRERAALPMIDQLARKFPDLLITIEHISAKETAHYLRDDAPPNVGASVTFHHLVNTWRDLYRGPLLRSHFHCAPCLKDSEDVDAIWDLIASGFGRLWFGSDSAPHEDDLKNSSEAPSGIFTEPFVLPGLAQKFGERGLLHLLDGFVCGNAAHWYNIRPERDRIVRLVSERWSPERSYGKIICPYDDLVLQLKVTA